MRTPRGLAGAVTRFWLGLCQEVWNLAGWGGVQFLYGQPFTAGITRVALQASAPSAVPLRLTLTGGSAACAPVEFTAGPAFVRAEVDVATACAGVADVRVIELQNQSSTPTDLVLDDVVLE